ncbi:MAG: hypothetical protein ABSH40_10875 [Bryobacteraceae bacterium]|jgi:hypothetical protein
MIHKPQAFAFGVGLALLVTIAAGVYRIEARKNRKVIVGTKDEVYYTGYATKEDARMLGQALTASGFLSNQGLSVLLSKGPSGASVSFVVKESAWNHPDTISSYEVIGRRIAPSIGGFPITVRLLDSSGHIQKLTVGRVLVGTRDEVYYFGSATQEDAQGLGQALKTIGFFADLGASVVISKGDGTAIWFVTSEGFWDKPEAIAGFERVARQVAASVGGLPIQVRLLNAEMETKKEMTIQ